MIFGAEKSSVQAWALSELPWLLVGWNLAAEPNQHRREVGMGRTKPTRPKWQKAHCVPGVDVLEHPPALAGRGVSTDLFPLLSAPACSRCARRCRPTGLHCVDTDGQLGVGSGL